LKYRVKEFSGNDKFSTKGFIPFLNAATSGKELMQFFEEIVIMFFVEMGSDRIV